MNDLKSLERLLRDGKISRREFLARASMLGLAAAVSPALLSSPARAATPKRGGTLKVAVQGGATSDSLDPATITQSMTQLMGYLFRNNLVEISPDMTPVPELAESWESSPDAKQWIFRLRKGVEFHNGKTLEAEDVLYSINHHRKEDSKSAAKSLLKTVTDLKAEDKYSVRFTLAVGSADFPYLMNDYHMTIFPAGTKEFNDGMGTGPFVLESFEPGVSCKAKRNPNYFKEGKPYFDAIEVIHIPDVNARQNALKTGEVDLINRCDLKTFHLLKRMKGIQGIETHGMMHYNFTFMVNRPPFDNNDVRLGLKHAIDREHVVKQILRGHGVPGNDHPIATVNRYHNKDLPQRAYDPEKAKFHLKKAGMLGETFTLHVSDEGFPGAVDAGMLYQQHAAKAGIKLKIQREPADGYWNDVWMKKPWCAVYWGGRITEDWMFTTTYAADAPWNDSKWKHDRFNKLLISARAELDENKRREMYYEMQKICRDDGPVIVMAFTSYIAAGKEKLGFNKQAATWEFDGWKFSERWWFKS